jgi:hypothetical protein
MLELERCIHQGVDVGHHALFKEQWERCKNCAYDPENNKKCPGYSPVVYSIPENIPEFNLSIVYSVVRPDLNKAIA